MSFDFPPLKKQSRATGGWIKGCCPLHDDKSPSFSYDPETGAWSCFSNCGKGNYDQFLEQYDTSALDQLKESRKKAKKKNNPPPITKNPPIKESYVKKCQEHMNKKMTKALVDKRGINIETIEKYQIGWDVDEQRWTIPIRDEKGKLGNVRMYNGINKDRFRMMPYKQMVKGKSYTYGSPARLFGLDELIKHADPEAIICEGEFDRLLLQQHGFMAVTATNGCKSFMIEWVRYFENKDVVIIQDCDSPGQLAATGKLLKFFEGAGIKSIKNIILPLEGTKKDKDITDYFHIRGHTTKDLRALIDSTEVHVYESEEEGAKEPIIVLGSFTEVEKEDMMDKRVQCDIVVSGETSASFCAVQQFEVEFCKTREDGTCVKCVRPIDLPKNSKEYIGSCMSTEDQVTGMLRKYCCKFGKAPTINKTKTLTVKEFFAHQTVKREPGMSNKQELIEKKCYYLSSNHVNPGAYLATGYVKANPKTQEITFLIEELIAQEDDYQSFTVEKEIKHLEAYRKFSLNEIIKDLTDNVTNIYQRDELLLTVLLTFFSPLWIPFNNEMIRGWIISIIIGDSGLGKTQTYNRISDYITAGDFFSCLTGTRTGLAYALVDNPHRGWQVKIGRYPANSGKLLAVDEVQHLEVKDLQSISKAMDEGFLQIDKVKSKGYETMTRMIMLCNPKYDRVMDECMYGCQALTTIFPPTILRRVDFAVFANAGDMTDYTVLNKENKNRPKISREMLRSAVFWAWNLTPDQIHIEASAKTLCLDLANALSMKFGNAVDIPLVAPSDFRYNLIRIATSFGAIVMSTDDFKTLIVKKEHVHTAGNFIKMIYEHQSSSLDKYSDVVKMTTHLLDYDLLEGLFMKRVENAEDNKAGNNFVKIIYQFKIMPKMRRDDLKDLAGCSLETVKRHISFLRACHLIKSGKDGYKKQPKFVKFLRELDRRRPEFFDGMKLAELGLEEEEQKNEWDI